jgi:hypothetical protein
MELRNVVPDATSATALADRLIVAFGSEHVSLRDGRREVDVRIDREPDSTILRCLAAVERWLDQARVGSVEMWLGERSTGSPGGLRPRSGTDLRGTRRAP